MKQIHTDVCSLELCGLLIQLGTTSERLFSPSALRWRQATQQVNAVMAGHLHCKKASGNGLGNTRICEMPEEALGIGTRTGPGMCNRELTFEMLILLPDLFGEG